MYRSFLPPIIKQILLFLLLSAISPLYAETLYLGSVGDDPSEEIEEFQSLAVYLKDQLEGSKIDQVNTIVAANVSEMAGLIASNKVHLYIDSPFPSLVVANKAKSNIFLRRWKKGVSEYRSVIFSRKDSGIDSLDAMKGQIVVFEDSSSTSSFFLPKTTMLEYGLKLKPVTQGDSVADDTVGFLFSDDDRNTMIWVLREKIAIGAMNETAYKKLAKKRLKDLQVIAASQYVPRHVISHSPNMDPALVEQVRQILLHMHEREDGREALKAFSKTTRFDDFPGGVEEHIAPLRRLLKYYK